MKITKKSIVGLLAISTVALISVQPVYAERSSIVLDETPLELGENRLDYSEGFSSWRDHVELEETLLREDNTIDFHFTYGEGYTNAGLTRSGIHISNATNTQNEGWDWGADTYEEGNYYLVDGYLNFEEEDMQDYLFSIIDNWDNGFFNTNGHIVLQARNYNESTGYIREIYYAEGNSTTPIHNLTTPDRDNGRDNENLLIGNEATLTHFGIYEIENEPE